MGEQAHRLTIAGTGWADEETVRVARPSFSRSVDGPGTLRCLIATRDLYRLGYDVRPGGQPLKGMWAYLEHRTAGMFAGVATFTRVDTYWIEAMVEDFRALLRKRVVPIDDHAQSAPAGSLALRAIRDVQRGGDALWIASATADETGSPVEFDWRGGDLHDDVLRGLVSVSGHRWTVTPDREFRWRERLGEDKRGDVTLVEGRHIVNPVQTGDLWTLANSITGTASDRRWRDTTAYTVDDNTSIDRYGGRRYEETRDYPYATRSTIVPHVEEDVRRGRHPVEVMRMEMVDHLDAWANVREGDIVTVVSPSTNAISDVDVETITYDLTTEVATVAARVLLDGVAA